ncbi:hypothetical protein PCASD_01904 [Puccinia coronata f. sp. avenae]|uniref:CCHC-type domain-containing protein n=1 Tax=Puccinia coronata f. sp. avenae TaxID=200324 RepID=A0A2N5VJM4_9BASI|nr:hypothetical protein PCASD_01904 [Puccinia coronata f. sp. avenae]
MDERMADTRDEVILNLQHQIQQLVTNAANSEARLQQSQALIQQTQNQIQQLQEIRPEQRPETAKLPEFDGKGDVDIWIKKVETILRNRHYPENRWSATAIEALKDTAESFWYELASEWGNEDIPWATFKKKITDQFNYAHHQYDVRLALHSLKYTGADDFINKFKRLAMKLPQSKATDEDKKFLFTVNLPAHHREKILAAKCDTIDDMCLLLREMDRISKSSHYKGSSGNFNYFSGFRNNHQNPGHQQHRRTSSTPNFHRSGSSAAPMDLDAVDASKARCYNCNKIGHLSKDCPSPRKIKFKQDKGKSKPMLNLIDLEESETDCEKNLFFIEPVDSNTDMRDGLDMIKPAGLNPLAIRFVPGARKHGITRKLELNSLRLNQLGPEKSLPRYEFGIGGIICDTIIDSGAGAIYLDLQVGLELYERREMEVVQIKPRNVRLANGTVEQVNSAKL